MKYIQADIHVNREGIEPVLTALMNVDIMDTVVEDPADIADLLDKDQDWEWDYVDDSVIEMQNAEPKVTVYMEDDEEGRRKLAALQGAIEELKTDAAAGAYGEDVDLGPLTVDVYVEDDSEWKDNWKEFFKPKKVGKRIVVKPTWYDYEKEEGDLVIEIDPGMAFGTGTHETTSLCLRLMEDYMADGDKVLDVGCGSGILAIAGALLGSPEVLGVEIDPVAVEIAQENLELNGVTDVARAQYGDLTKGIDFKAEIVVANLMADLVMMLSADVAKHILPGGKYISSGILVEKRDQVAAVIRDCGFDIVEIREDGMWCAIVATPKEA
ncbi:MAG: 50S ribosomal protein L11 methyltransferase [Firmicutes bacterium]|nr:50S ribosomal protein L11 methyltransferase [Bacillota bacterium]